MKKSILLNNSLNIDPRKIPIGKMSNVKKKQISYSKKIKTLRRMGLLPFCYKNVNIEV